MTERQHNFIVENLTNYEIKNIFEGWELNSFLGDSEGEKKFFEERAVAVLAKKGITVPEDEAL